MNTSIIPNRFNGVENLISYLFRATQFIVIGLSLALGNMQPIFLCQVKTGSPVSVEIIFIRNGFGMVIYSTEHDMTEWIILVEMTDNDVWSIHDAHFIHIFLSNLYHCQVINLILVVGMEVQRNMSNRIFQVRIQGEIIFKRVDNPTSSLDSRYIFIVDKTPFFAWRTVGIILLSASDITDGKSRDVSCRITNTGNRSGAEVVQLYLRDVVASVSQPPMLLKGFTRIELSPGERRTTTFNLGAEELSIYNAELERVNDPGIFKVMIGASSADIRLTGDFTL